MVGQVTCERDAHEMIFMVFGQLIPIDEILLGRPIGFVGSGQKGMQAFPLIGRAAHEDPGFGLAAAETKKTGRQRWPSARRV